MERLRQIVERESSQAEVSKLNLQITRRELSEKQAAIEEVVEKALAEEAQEAAERRKRELAAAAVKERDEADAAIADVYRAEGEFQLPATSGLQTMEQTEIFGQAADSTVGATGTNLPIAGICTEFVSATQLWVEVGPRARI
jgi:hypothetical protein